MRSIKTPAVLLKRVDYSEKDRIAVLFTPEYGKVSAMAKGARGAHSRFGACLEPFSLFEAELSGTGSQGLAFLKSAHLKKNHPRLLRDLDAISTAFSLMELVDAFEHDSHPSHELFVLLTEALDGLDQGKPGLPLKLAFEARLIQHAGVAPDWRRCASCAEPLSALGAGFSFRRGGLLCRRCGSGGTDFQVDAPTLASLQAIFLGEAPSGEGSSKRADGVLERLLQYHLGKELKSGVVRKSLELPWTSLKSLKPSGSPR